MRRSEIQEKTGLTRKAIEYYEEKGLIKPLRLENGYRNYSDEDLEILNKISVFRKVGLSLSEIKVYLFSNGNSLSSVLRRKECQLDIDEKKKEVIELIVKNNCQNVIDEKIALIEVEESIYEKLENAFPGYFGQLIFSSYQPFLNETLDSESKDAYEKFIEYLDNLPPFNLSKEEKDYIEVISATYDMKSLKEINSLKIDAIENAEKWLEDNKNVIELYQDFKNSDEYQNSTMKIIQDRLHSYMLDNKYYETAIPLIRKFSKAYNDYYEKILVANDKYLKTIN